MKESHFLVTGGCGFIGSHLADALLAHGAGVTILDNLSYGLRANAPGGADLRVGDIRDGDVTGELIRNSDGVFHLAAISSVQACTENWRESHTVNLTGSICVFEHAARSARRTSNTSPRRWLL